MRSLLLGLVFCVLCLGQERVSLMQEVGSANLPSQTLGIDDLVAVSVYDAPELTRTVRIEQDGTVHLPLLSEGVAAVGIMPRQLEARIASALKAAELMVEPVVKVTVVEYHSRPISVMGAVRRPTTFQAAGKLTLLDALARAEGLAVDAGPVILISRESEMVEVSVKRLLNGADPSANLALHGGEEIRIPEAGKIFVAGNVARPGAFSVRDPADQTVMKLVALSEGLLPFARDTAYIFRRNEDGLPQEIPIELERIMERKAPDVILQAGDTLYVPDNKSRRTTMGIIDRLTSFGTTTASGVLVWRR
jgi:polysaccharide export outer membrane protein